MTRAPGGVTIHDMGPESAAPHQGDTDENRETANLFQEPPPVTGLKLTLAQVLGQTGQALAKPAKPKPRVKPQEPAPAPEDTRPLLAQLLDHQIPVERVARMVETRCACCGNVWRGPKDDGGAVVFLRSRIGGPGNKTEPSLWAPLPTRDSFSHLPLREDWTFRTLAFCPACIDQGGPPE